MTRVEAYFEAASENDDPEAFRVLDGWAGASSFRIRYAVQYAQLLVKGRIREHRGHSTIVVTFHERPIPLKKPLLAGVAALAAWYWFHLRVDWLSLVAPIVVGVLGWILVPGTGTSAGLADAISEELASTLDAVRL